MMNDPLAISSSKLPNFRSGAQIPTSTPANTLPPGVTPSNTPTPLPSNTPTRTPTFTATVPPGSPSAISLTGTCDATGNALFTIFDVGLPLPSGVRIRWRMFDDGVEIGTGGLYSPLPQTVSSEGGTFGNIRLMIWEVRDPPTNYSLVTTPPARTHRVLRSATPTNTSTAVPCQIRRRAYSSTRRLPCRRTPDACTFQHADGRPDQHVDRCLVGYANSHTIEYADVCPDPPARRPPCRPRPHWRRP
ncbi:MAG: hypothetical protein U0703_14110 [Anaerolineae bacterium]